MMPHLKKTNVLYGPLERAPSLASIHTITNKHTCYTIPQLMNQNSMEVPRNMVVFISIVYMEHIQITY